MTFLICSWVAGSSSQIFTSDFYAKLLIEVIMLKYTLDSILTPRFLQNTTKAIRILKNIIFSTCTSAL